MSSRVSTARLLSPLAKWLYVSAVILEDASEGVAQRVRRAKSLFQWSRRQLLGCIDRPSAVGENSQPSYRPCSAWTLPWKDYARALSGPTTVSVRRRRAREREAPALWRTFLEAVNGAFSGGIFDM
jgi:hypothetical protein